MSKQALIIFGSTGSIGVQTLAVVALHPDHYQIEALTAHHQYELLFLQCQQFSPRYAVLVDESAAIKLREKIREAGLKTEVFSGHEALIQLAQSGDYDIAVAAIVGAAGLLSSLAAVKAGKRVLLANKEALVMAGELFMQAVVAHQVTLLPIDSEHNAIFQCLPDYFLPGQALPKEVSSLILTASGGPFLNYPVNQLQTVTREKALQHPNWSMGAKISIDSATMMNKGLELIECHWLFAAPLEKIEVIIHPQSVVHSMVRYQDGSVLAQLGQPDMRTPIAHTLSWPSRISNQVPPLDFTKIGRLEFQAVDPLQFPCLNLAYAALKAGGTAACVLNAANEEAVSAFLAGAILFTEIAAINTAVLEASELLAANQIEDILQADQKARVLAQNMLKKHLSNK